MNHPRAWRALFNLAGLSLAALMLSCGGGGGSTPPPPPPAPVATSLTTSNATPAFGGTFTLTPTYSAGTGTLNNSVVCPASGVATTPITANWAGARIYTLTVTNTAGTTDTKSVTVTPQVVAVGAISPANATRTVSTVTTFTTTVTGGALNTVTWSATAGTFAGDVWTAPPTAGVVTITATSVDDPTKTVTTTVNVESSSPPVATSLVASTATPAFGATFTLTPTYANGAGVIDNGVTCPASGAVVNVTANWVGMRTFTLTVTNGTVSATTSVDVTPQIVVVGAISPATVTRTVSTTTTFAATVNGGALNTVTWTASAGTFAGDVWTAPGTAGSVTITATSVDDPTQTATTTVTVVDAPIITSFTAAKGTITNGTGTSLSYAFTGGDGSIDQTIGAVISGGTTNVAPTSDTTYILTVTNAAGDTDTETVTVTVVAPAHITVFTASASTVTPGTTVTLHPEFENGVGTLNQSLGTATNNVDVTTAALTVTTTFTLTVTNAAGDLVTESVTVYVVAGTFTGAGNMSTARSAPTATLLADNSILIVGGTSGGSLATAEIYSGGTTYTVTTGSMAVGRHSHTATRLADGKVLITGGWNSAAAPGSEVLATAEIYDPANGGSFAPTGSMATARMDHTATLLPSGKVLIAGGTDGLSIKGAELFNPLTGTFEALTLGNAWTPARARATHTATLLANGKVLLAGGYNGSVRNTADVFDWETNTFIPVGDMTAARWGHTATGLADGKVLIVGGRAGEVNVGNVLASAEIFDPAGNAGVGTFTSTVVDMTTAREWHVATLLPNGTVLIAGGDRDEFGVPTDADINLQSAEIYNPLANTFTATGNMATPRINFTATVIPTTGYVLVVGGGVTPATQLFQ